MRGVGGGLLLGIFIMVLGSWHRFLVPYVD